MACRRGSAAGSVAAPSEAPSAFGMTCFLCLGDGDGQMGRFRQQPMHPACIDATRAYVRQIAKIPGAVKQMEGEMESDAVQWRRKVLPFIEKGPASRMEARACVGSERPAGGRDLPPVSPFSFVESGFRSDYTDSYNLFMVLNKTRYTSFRMFWDRVPEEDAEADFEMEHLEQGDEFDDPITKEERVKVPDNYVMRKGQLAGAGRAAENRQPIDEAEYKRRRIAAQMSSLGDDVLTGDAEDLSGVQSSSSWSMKTPPYATGGALAAQDLQHPFSHHPDSLSPTQPLPRPPPAPPNKNGVRWVGWVGRGGGLG